MKLKATIEEVIYRISQVRGYHYIQLRWKSYVPTPFDKEITAFQSVSVGSLRWKEFVELFGDPEVQMDFQKGFELKEGVVLEYLVGREGEIEVDFQEFGGRTYLRVLDSRPLSKLVREKGA